MQGVKQRARSARAEESGRSRAKEPIKKAIPLGDSAYGIIKGAIVDCEIDPGAELTQSELIDRFNLTNAQARHALVRLTQEGWVRPLPQRGYLVAPLTMKDLEDIYEMRMLIEPPAMRKAAGRINPETRKHLEKLGDADYTPGDRASIRRFLRSNREFFMIIARCCDNKLLAKTIDQLFDSSNRLLYFSMLHSYDSDAVRRGHQKLVEALVRGDGKEVERLRRAGLDHGKQAVRRALLSMPSVMDINLIN